MVQQLIAVVLTLGLLGGFYGYVQTYPTPEDAEPYHAEVRDVIEAVPARFDGWVGQQVPVPAQAVDLLKPNALLSRHYVHRETGRSVSLLIAHCQTARDLAGHYPPICYPSAGWVARGEQAAPLPWSGGTMPFMRYTFRRSLATSDTMVDVWNVLMVRGSEPSPDMRTVRRQAEGYLTHFFGAGQVQFLFDSRIPREQQQAIIAEFRPVIQPVVQAITDAHAATAAR
jgi:hypothetical protein